MVSEAANSWVQDPSEQASLVGEEFEGSGFPSLVLQPNHSLLSISITNVQLPLADWHLSSSGMWFLNMLCISFVQCPGDWIGTQLQQITQFILHTWRYSPLNSICKWTWILCKFVGFCQDSSIFLLMGLWFLFKKKEHLPCIPLHQCSPLPPFKILTSLQLHRASKP